MMRRSCTGRSAPRRLAARTLAAAAVVALAATACGSSDAAPTLSSERPPPPAAAPAPSSPQASASASAPPGTQAAEAPQTPTTTAVPIDRTTEPTILVQPPAPEGALTTADGEVIPPPPLPDVPLPEEMENPDITRLSGDQIPPVPPPTVPAATPPWSPVTVLVAKDEVNGILPVYDAPGGTRLAFPDGDLWSYTYRRNRLVTRLLQGSPGDEWVRVELPVRPNGASGWVRSEHFNWSTVNHHILIDVSDRSVALYDGNDLVTSTGAIVGKPETPTPTLKGFLVEKLPNHSQENGSIVLGDWILMLSFFSEALNSFGGGLPRIALHGTHIPERVGEALSNGCIRIPNDIVTAIAQRAPLGTVVNIVT